MKVCGFTIARNVVKFDYPIKEAIQSILPLCDHFVVAVGKSDDNTLEYVQSILPADSTIVHTVWDDSLREGGRVLALETDKALAAIPPGFDWAFYIQGDEVIHEKYLPVILEAMKRYRDDPGVDGLLFRYRHFYGSYDYVGESLKWYRREIRVIKSRPDIFSYKDAQGFRKKPNDKLRVKLLDAEVYHYGWVREPKALKEKLQSFHRMYFDDQWMERNSIKSAEFDYGDAEAVSQFEGTHPAAMKERIQLRSWKYDRDVSFNRFSMKDRLKMAIERWTGWRVGEYRNYKIV
ncbi:MAG: glycosyltransferase family 2 protein [Cyclobacteriaceae bacterium]|nr:glycosyltransferase family 2 protein [Cyclobacteriaceae bacterium]